jgi:hypothetical protein
MLIQITLAAGLLAIGADPAATTFTPRSLPSAYQQPQQTGEYHPGAQNYAYGEEFGGTSEGGCAGCTNWHHTCGPQNFRCHFLFSPCNMSQHMPFWNKERGYYYFRPYHVVHVLQQQEMAASWGGNPKDPYDNRFLDKIHEEWAADYQLRKKAEQVEDLPNVPGEMPLELEEPKTSEGGAVEPKPIAPDPTPSIQPKTPTPPEGDGAARPSSLKKFVTFAK